MSPAATGLQGLVELGETNETHLRSPVPGARALHRKLIMLDRHCSAVQHQPTCRCDCRRPVLQGRVRRMRTPCEQAHSPDSAGTHAPATTATNATTQTNASPLRRGLCRLIVGCRPPRRARKAGCVATAGTPITLRFHLQSVARVSHEPHLPPSLSKGR